MSYKIKKAAVLGAGVMGATIAEIIGRACGNSLRETMVPIEPSSHRMSRLRSTGIPRRPARQTARRPQPSSEAGSPSSPSLTAMIAAWVRLVAPSLLMIRWTCFLTVTSAR